MRSSVWSKELSPGSFRDTATRVDLSAAQPKLLNRRTKSPAEVRANGMPIEEISDGFVCAPVDQHEISIVAGCDLPFSVTDTEPSSDVHRSRTHKLGKTGPVCPFLGLSNQQWKSMLATCNPAPDLKEIRRGLHVGWRR